ncbi:hypothetical protein COCNU_11G007870 [Cocos nucifera]|uniref:Uncharacterized protein n=1 Tax=Cocos nucifera TaxID=13894 RepID=A0A8K0IPW6_COCNU|nr:hypothetical protein COCNU_11G007870 [Cocos nucifera]
MSALVCGKRSSSVFEELLHTPPPSSKRARCSAGASSPTAILLSPVRPSSASSSPAFDRNDDDDDNNSGGSCNPYSPHLAHLRSLFPNMDPQIFLLYMKYGHFSVIHVKKRNLLCFDGIENDSMLISSSCILVLFLERALEASGNDLDSAIKSLNDLHLESADINFDSARTKPESGIETNIHVLTEGVMNNNGAEEAAENPHGAACLPTDGSEWVDLFVGEMMNATDMDDARVRASRVLEVLEKSIVTHASAEAMQNFHRENVMLKEQVEVVLRENAVLKRAVAIQHERQNVYEERSQELQRLKQLVSQYQEQLRTLEVNNYALTMHLRQAQQSSSIPGRFHPDVF